MANALFNVVRAIGLSLIFAMPAFAIDSFQLPEDPATLTRYQVLAEEFRCLVCQNQNLADSNADLANDLKRELVELLESGKSDDQIREFLVARYGDFVLYRPPVNKATAMLWLAPLIGVLGIGLVVVLLWRRGRNEGDVVTAEPVVDEDISNALNELRAAKAEPQDKES
ncbi:MAG: cytochrome c-type biogenesis protein CcmH [Gammaproteobacteria bacterium]|nr:cytochrome c-type biogenesis protein CcmH [Gammaproteobacteria bacterium]